jgi:hypothetical protein
MKFSPSCVRCGGLLRPPRLWYTLMHIKLSADWVRLAGASSGPSALIVYVAVHIKLVLIGCAAGASSGPPALMIR